MAKKIIPRSGARVEHLVMRRHSLETSPQRESPLAYREFRYGSRPFDETVHDTLRWLVETGHLEPKYVGTLCTAASRPTSRA